VETDHSGLHKCVPKSFNQLKIAVIIYSLDHGGAEKQAVTDANALQEKGHQVTLLYNKPGELLETLHNEVSTKRIKPTSQITASLAFFFHLLRQRYDILHAHMFWAEKISAFPAFLTRHKLVFNEHGLGKWRRWYHRRVMQLISLCADKVICSCRLNCKLRHDKENIPANKLQTIYNGFFLQEEAKEAISQKQSTSAFTIGFIGRFHEVKRIHTFIDVASRLYTKIPSLKFILVGDGHENENFRKTLEEKGLADYFELPGFQSQTAKYYHQFDVFVLPSRIEGFSISLLEAGSYGIPAIAYDVGGNSEIIEHGKTGYIFRDNDVEAIAEHIYYLFQHPEERKSLGENARNKIFSKFTLENRIEKLEKLYQEL
jgi:glycosyltransferase involved in cell wall biosynthesis